MKGLEYRADIDGLRALAVLAVIIFHINPECMPNGFLGVDVFFVISGFLITSILYEAESRQELSLRSFYAKRARRILPVFFVVVAVSLALAYWLFLPTDALAIGKSAIAAILFAANFYHARHSDYFDVGAEEQPLLHLWSLSIEEQFYFIFPALLLGLLAIGRKLSAKRKHGEHSFVLTTLIALAVLSLASSLLTLDALGINLNPYYLSHTRFGELLVGSTLAVYLSRGRNPLEPTKASLIGGIALALLLASFYWRGAFISPWFPGLLALVPAIATALLIYANASPSPLRRLCSLAPMVWLGKLSYSLYLWHWVVLAFIRYFWGVGVLPLWLIALAIVLTLGASIATYYLVEQPIRRHRYSLGISLVKLYALPALIVVLIFCAIKRLPPAEGAYFGFLDKTSCCFDTLEGDCLMGDQTKAPKVLIAGDSHTGHLSRFWDYVGQREGWSAFVSASKSCPFFFGYDYYDPWQIKDFCAWRNAWLREKYQHYPIIVLANYWGSPEYAADPKFVPALVETLKELLKHGKRVYLVNSCYQVSAPPSRAFYADGRGLPLPLEQCGWRPRGDLYAETRGHAERIKKLVMHQFPSVQWIDLEPYLPSNFIYDDKPILGDNRHLNAYGAEVLAKIFSRKNRLIQAKDLQ
ncbi:MAG: acyltransferase family protein [Porphyromonadaceae bacterium]|nr:acyltransferase family protein [Porphyromonadaceae bacterium]